MPIANATTAASVVNLILTETIERAIRFEVQSPRLYDAFVHLPQTLVNTNRYKVNVIANFTAMAPATEGVEVVAQELDPNATNIDCTLFATSSFLGDWANQLAAQPQIPTHVRQLMEANSLSHETACMALATTMTNSMGSSATTFDGDTFVHVTSAFRAQAKHSAFMPMMVLSESAKRDLNVSLMKSGAGIYSSLVGPQLHAAVSGTNQGEWVEYKGIMIASSDLVPTVSAGKGNFIVHMGGATESALALAFSLDPRITIEARASRLGMHLVVSDAHGAGHCDQQRSLRFVTKN